MSEKIRPQARNANRHNPRGMAALENSIATDGWIGAITVAADGETFDGSARVEKTAENGMLEGAVIIDSDGSRPIVVRRTDIPTATDERAVRLGINANRIASLNLEWEPDVLAGLAADFDLSSLNFTPLEWADVSAPALPEAGNGGDEFDPTPEEGETRTKLGELWSIGGKHRLLVGDCTDPANVARLMGGEKAQGVFTSPPYNQQLSSQAQPTGMHKENKWFHRLETAYSDSMPEDKYQEWQIELLTVWFDAVVDGGACFYNHKHRYRDRRPIIPLDWIRKTPWELRQEIIWDRRIGVAANAGMFIPGDERFYWLEKDGDHVWNGVGNNRTTVWPIPPQQNDGEHVCPYPLELVTIPIEAVTNSDDIIADPFLGSGTTLIAAHRTNRRCYGMEIAPRYADVILRRAEAEGLECELINTPMEC